MTFKNKGSSMIELKNRYESFFGKGTFNKLLDAKNKYSKNQYIRVNLSKTTVDEIAQFLKANRVRYSKTFLPNALKIEKSFFNLSSSLPALTGKIYLQDLASQIPVNTINFTKLKGKKISVLDMAASPGSKTTQIADILTFNKIEHEIIALEPDKKRLIKLINNIQRQGFENIQIFNVLGEDFNWLEKFDIILLDAPCSGNLIDDPKWLDKRDICGIREKCEIQKKLLKKASDLLNEGGQLIYSTCSLEPEENEMNIKWILNNSNLKPFKIDLKLPFITKPLYNQPNSIRLMPYNSQTQGFFIGKFEK